MSEIPHARPFKDNACEAMFRGRRIREPSKQASIFNSIWWSQTGSNRRPHACKARALPAELWPRTRRRNALRRSGESQQQRENALDQMVGLGRLELPTSRLSSARSNQLSYKPLTLILNQEDRVLLAQPPATAPDASHKRKPLARVRPRRKRNEDGEIPPMELNNPEIAGP
jgi:hypothetical protein